MSFRKKVIRFKVIPQNSTILNGFGKIDYQDIYQINKDTDKTAEEISKEILRLPDWAIALFKLRNSIVGIFGLKTEKEEQRDTFFTLIEKDDNEIVLGETDKHLDFRLSIIKNKSENTISLITIVHFNNIWGKVYFLPVKPFHKLIVKSLLKRYLKV